MKSMTRRIAAATFILISTFTFSTTAAYAGDPCAGHPASMQEILDNPCYMK